MYIHYMKTLRGTFTARCKNIAISIAPSKKAPVDAHVNTQQQYS